MDITAFLVAARDKVDQPTDYGRYRTRLSHRLHTCRQKLHVTSKHRGPFNPKATAVQPAQVAADVGFVHLLLLSAERAHAHAVAMRTVQAARGKNVNHDARAHIVSRLDKAAKYAEHLVAVLRDPASGASSTDCTEARAYAAALRGAANLERRAWPRGLADHAAAWALYGALATAAAAEGRPAAAVDVLRDRVAAHTPWVRFAAHQLRKPRSTPVATLVHEALAADTDLTAIIDALDPTILHPVAPAAAEGMAVDGGDGTGRAAPVAPALASARTIHWRARAVRIEDAPIAAAWAAVDVARARLLAVLVAGGVRMTPADRAAAYDDVLTASQDAVDAAKAAIDDLRADGLAQSDPAVQLLYIARTAANYEMIGYRIGRNRVLAGPRDGAVLPAATTAAAATPGRVLARLKERVVLYDGVLQSLETVLELPGVAADADLTEQLTATTNYFVALKSLAVARSHEQAGHAAHALALLKHAHDLCLAAKPVLAQADLHGSDAASVDETPLRTLRVSPVDVHFLSGLLQNELQRARALVDIAALQEAAAATTPPATTLAERLAVYPHEPLDLDTLVAYPPRLVPVPVKPIFLDVAWNYIEYPGTSAAAAAAAAAATKTTAAVPAKNSAPVDAQEKPKRGWFGFGR